MQTSKFILSFAIFGCTVVCAEETPPASPAGQQESHRFFESKVRPILARRCYQCHSVKANKTKGELALDVAARLRSGGARGPLFNPGKPDESLLIQAVRYLDNDLQMPPSGKLPAAEITALSLWIAAGGVIPDQPAPQAPSNPRDFWSFQPLRRFALPSIEQTAWPRQPIDWFILCELEARGLKPTDEADRRTLIRRVAFDLLGLPPTDAEVTAFINDRTPQAYDRLIDRLLASPHYGERWGRHWLDLARYTDATASWLQSTGQAWLYRDWIVRALNEDRSYRDFVQQQIAADRMPGGDPQDISALGFVGLSPTYWKELKLAPDVIKVVVAEEWEERIDAFSRTFLGLTVACARCHDHKFDPVTMQDYYALAGVFANTKLADRPLLPPAEAERVLLARAKVADLDAQIGKLKKTAPDKAAELQKQADEIRKSTPHFDPPMAHAVEEASIHVLADGPDATRVEYRPGEMLDLPVFQRGDPTSPGDITQRRFLEILSDADSQPFSHGSGRLELAESLFREGLPLTARVIVNRVWRHHFGRGLVATPSNFGVQGERPTHPELLDDLTARFVAGGWSLKSLHREILLSATYRQASKHDPVSSQIDPENHYLWRMNRRRLDVESWRDAVLAASGELDLQIGGSPTDLNNADNRRRTVYGTIGRRDLNGMLALYDFPQPTAHSPGRDRTTTPLQQLFVLNSPFFQKRAHALAKRLDAKAADSLVNDLYRRLWQRPPTAAEVTLALQFLGDPASSARREQYVHVLLGSNESIFVD